MKKVIKDVFYSSLESYKKYYDVTISCYNENGDVYYYPFNGKDHAPIAVYKTELICDKKGKYITEYGYYLLDAIDKKPKKANLECKK